MTSTFAGWEMGEVKLEEAAMAIPIISAWGDIPKLDEVFRAMGVMSTTRAAVGTKQVARNVNPTRPSITALGPKKVG